MFVGSTFSILGCTLHRPSSQFLVNTTHCITTSMWRRQVETWTSYSSFINACQCQHTVHRSENCNSDDVPLSNEETSKSWTDCRTSGTHCYEWCAMHHTAVHFSQYCVRLPIIRQHCLGSPVHNTVCNYLSSDGIVSDHLCAILCMIAYYPLMRHHGLFIRNM